MALPPPHSPTAALVTGCSSGLGEEIARGVARRGYDVVLVARRLDRLESLAGELAREHGVRAEPVACDVGDAEDRDRLVAAVDELGMTVEILVNNAGLGSTGRFQHLEALRQQEIVRVNTEALVGLCGEYVPSMVSRGRGGVLNMGSTTAFQPMTRNATYAASKAFVLSFTEALHADLSGTGVTATVVCPGPVRTELWADSGATSIADGLPGFLWTSARTVADQGLDGLADGRRVVVPGLANQLSAIGGQHVPRPLLLRMSTLMSRNAMGESR